MTKKLRLLIDADKNWCMRKYYTIKGEKIKFSGRKSDEQQYHTW